MKRIRSLVVIVLAALAGAFAGHAVAQMRERYEAGQDPMSIDPERLRVQPQEVIAGVVAGFRMGEPPWSWLHIPGWLAAFAVTFAGAALSGDLQRLREMLEHAGISGEPHDEALEFEGPFEGEADLDDGWDAPASMADRPAGGETPPYKAPPHGDLPHQPRGAGPAGT